jgi:hypothetical protein
MTETLRLTIVYEDGGDGWVVASIPEVPGTHSQGRSREEARENVIGVADDAHARRGAGHAGRRRAAHLHCPAVKRRALEAHLREHGCRVVGGTKHEKLRGPTGRASVLPRHNEIA